VNANPGVQSQQLFQGGVESAIGGQQRAIEQARLDEEIRKFYALQDADGQKAAQLLALIQGMPGATTTSNATGSVAKPNKWAAAGGGALAGGVAGSTFGPVGTAAGAAGGGLLGLLTS